MRTVSLINGVMLQIVQSSTNLPDELDLDQIAAFLHQALKPYEDTQADIRRALGHVLESEHHPRGFLVLATDGASGNLVGAAVVHFTPWSGYVPENLLLFIAVSPASRGRGIGRALLDAVVAECEGDIKLHVEHDNPARRLYERVGFTSKYAEMRLTR